MILIIIMFIQRRKLKNHRFYQRFINDLFLKHIVRLRKKIRSNFSFSLFFSTNDQGMFRFKMKFLHSSVAKMNTPQNMHKIIMEIKSKLHLTSKPYLFFMASRTALS